MGDWSYCICFLRGPKDIMWYSTRTGTWGEQRHATPFTSLNAAKLVLDRLKTSPSYRGLREDVLYIDVLTKRNHT